MSRTKRSIAAVLAAHVAFFGTTGCATVTTDVSRNRAPGAAAEAPGTVRVAVYDRRAQIADGVPSSRPVRTRLSRLEGKSFVPVHESEESSFTLADVPPGKYVFQITGWVDEKGKSQTDGEEEGFLLAPGEDVRIVGVLMDRRRNASITAVAVGGGALLLGAVVYAITHMFDSGEGGLLSPSAGHGRK